MARDNSPFVAYNIMASIVYLTTHAPSQFANDLEMAGYTVFEALAISEVLRLCETEQVDVVVIDASVDEGRAKVIQEHHIAVRLKAEATAKELIEELWRLLPDKSPRIQ